MKILDSSCWLEYLSGSALGENFEKDIENVGSLIVPAITIFEVFKKIAMEADEDRAIVVAAHMKQRRVVELDANLAIFAAQQSKELSLPMADSIIYATARKHGATLLTMDKHFRDLEGVVYYER